MRKKKSVEQINVKFVVSNLSNTANQNGGKREGHHVIEKFSVYFNFCLANFCSWSGTFRSIFPFACTNCKKRETYEENEEEEKGSIICQVGRQCYVHKIDPYCSVCLSCTEVIPIYKQCVTINFAKQRKPHSLVWLKHFADKLISVTYSNVLLSSSDLCQSSEPHLEEKYFLSKCIFQDSIYSLSQIDMALELYVILMTWMKNKLWRTLWIQWNIEKSKKKKMHWYWGGGIVSCNIKNGKKKLCIFFFSLLKGCLLTILFMYSYTVWRNATNVFPSDIDIIHTHRTTSLKLLLVWRCLSKDQTSNGFSNCHPLIQLFVWYTDLYIIFDKNNIKIMM